MSKVVAVILLCAGVLLNQGSAFAADKKKEAVEKDKKVTEVSAEKRQEMAMVHEKMATCLRSEKPIDECHEEMRSACSGMMGMEGCSMMGGMKHRGPKPKK